MKNLLLSILCLSICVSVAKAQRTCGNEIKSPKEAEIQKKQIEDAHKSFTKWKKDRSDLERSAVQITIPVHVILVHNPGDGINVGNNFSVDRVLSQIQVLNEDFGRTNSDASSTPTEFQAAGAEIDFCMATYDPEGNPTNGITRYASPSFSANETEILAATRWPRDQYLNIWVAQDLGSILGYAYLPTPGNLPDEEVDGVVISGPYFGGPGYSEGTPYDLGRTATHELGHWLGLRHVWGGGCGSDDGIDDTPDQEGPNSGCPTHPSPTCENNGDMFMNYMDYVNDACMNAFTKDQVDYMTFILEGTRNTLLSASASVCVPNGYPVIRINNQQNILCHGENNGRIEVNISAGLPPYSLSLDGGPAQSSNTFENLSGGNHVLDVAGADGKSSRVNFNIIEPEPFNMEVNVLSESCTGSASGSIQLTSEGGNPGFPTYTLFNQSFTEVQNVTYNEGLENGLPAGWVLEPGWSFGTSNELSSAFFQIPDSEHLMAFNDDALGPDHSGSGSFYTDWIDLNGETSFTLSFESYFLDLDYEGADERAIIYISGNNNTDWQELISLNGNQEFAKYNIEVNDFHSSVIKLRFLYDDGGGWNYGMSIDNILVNKNSFGIFDDLMPGQYTARVVDPLGCTYDQSVIVNDLDPVSFSSFISTNPTCAEGGSIECTASSVNGISYYELLGGTTNTNGLFNNLSAGTYTVRVYDLMGCYKDQSIELISPAGISVNLVNSNSPSCFGSLDGFFEINISSSNGNETIYLNGSQTDQTSFFGIGAGTYTIQVVNDQNCSASLDILLSDPSPINFQIETYDANCLQSGSIDLFITGGTPPYSYSLNFGTNEPAPGNIMVLPGNYIITVLDSLGCSKEDEFSIGFDGEMFSISENIIECATGDTTNYWIEYCTSNGIPVEWALYDDQGILLENLGTSDCASVDMTPYINSPDGLFFAIGATEANGCQAEFNSFVNAPIVIESNYDSNIQICEGEFFSLLLFNPQAFESIILLDDEDNELVTLGNSEYLCEADINYNLMTVDTNGCVGQNLIFINNIPLPSTTIGLITHVTNSVLGTVSFDEPIGIPPFTFSLNGEENTDGNFEGLLAGDYTMILTDGTGCSSSIDFTIEMNTSNSELQDDFIFSLRPNPAKDIIFIETSPRNAFELLQIYNTEGQLIKHIQTQNSSLQIDVSEFPSGLYLMSLQVNGAYRQKRFIVE